MSLSCLVFGIFALAFGSDTIPSFAASPTVEAPTRLSFPRLDGKTRLAAFLRKPGGGGPFPAVVFLHGCSGVGPGGGISSTYSAWARHLAQNGFATLLVDSMGSRGLGSTCGPNPNRRTMYRERPGDAYAALAFLQSRTDILAGRIGLMGWSQGGGITLLTVSGESIGRPRPPPVDDFKAAVALYPSACSERLQSRPYTTVDPGSWSTIAPLLVLHGARDNWAQPVPCQHFIEAAARRGEPARIIVYQEAAHSFDAPNLRLKRRSGPRLRDGSLPLIGTHPVARLDAMRRVVDFFGEHLKQ
ncbi:MAG: dienelactone hydrolase family protein [Pseudomonadota bacterium]